MTGEERWSKQKLTVLFAGYAAAIEKNFFAKLTFDDSYTENYIGKFWLWSIVKLNKKKDFQFSLRVIELPKSLCVFFKKRTCFFVPRWIHGAVNNSLPLKDSVKTDIRRIKKNKLKFELTKKLSQFKKFYYDMYLPYITKTFGNEAVIENYDYMKQRFKKGGMYNDLLLVKNDKEYIAGTLLGYKKDVLHLYELGVKNGNYNYVKDGAIGALFYFPLVHSIEKGLGMVDFGESRAFFNVGVLQFKKKRGLQITGGSKMGFLINPLDNTKPVREFFINNPFIYRDKKKFFIALFLDNENQFSPDDYEQIHKAYYMKGVSKLVINCIGKEGGKMYANIPQECAENISVHFKKNII
jgi:hypothetical protein